MRLVWSMKGEEQWVITTSRCDGGMPHGTQRIFAHEHSNAAPVHPAPRRPRSPRFLFDRTEWSEASNGRPGANQPCQISSCLKPNRRHGTVSWGILNRNRIVQLPQYTPWRGNAAPAYPALTLYPTKSPSFRCDAGTSKS
jgi:hypothetical protein